MNIFIIAHNRAIRTTLAQVVEDGGHEVCQFISSEAALAHSLWSSEKVQLVITDLRGWSEALQDSPGVYLILMGKRGDNVRPANDFWEVSHGLAPLLDLMKRQAKRVEEVHAG